MTITAAWDSGCRTEPGLQAASGTVLPREPLAGNGRTRSLVAEVTMSDGQWMDAELDLARMGVPPDGRLEELCRRVTDALIEVCHERFGVPTRGLGHTTPLSPRLQR